MKAGIVISGFAAFLAFGQLYQWTHTQWLLWLGGAACAVPLLLFVVVPAILPTEGSRRQARADFDQRLKEMGYMPYTKTELLEIEAEERANYNRWVERSEHGSRWVDYDGWLRDGETGKAIQYIGNHATGK